MPPRNEPRAFTINAADATVFADYLQTTETATFARILQEERNRMRHMDNFDEVPELEDDQEMEPIDDLTFKERHLTKHERDVLHRPKSDWIETGRGETCKSACTLEVEDIILTTR